MLISDSTIAPQNAGQKPLTTKSGDKSFEANINMSALMTHQKMPSVRNVSGSVMIFRKQPEGGVHQADDQRRDQRRRESLQVKSRHQVRNNQQADRTQQPIQQQTHVFLSDVWSPVPPVLPIE